MKEMATRIEAEYGEIDGDRPIFEKNPLATGCVDDGETTNRPLAVSFDEADEHLIMMLDRLRREEEEHAIAVIERENETERQLRALRVEAAGRAYEENEMLAEVAVQQREEDDLLAVAATIDASVLGVLGLLTALARLPDDQAALGHVASFLDPASTTNLDKVTMRIC